jgi:broad specificity phosphatase PhoE
MTLLYFARHGETEDNARLVFQGHAGKGLNDRGRAQARRLGERLKRTRFSAIIASDLERAAETAHIVGEAVGMAPSFDRDLREVDVGHWTGKSHAELAELYPEAWAAWSQGLEVDRGGETYAELAARIERAAQRALAVERDGPVLLVSHGGAIKSYASKVMNLSVDGVRALGSLHNTSISVIGHGPHGRYRLHRWNDAAHLEDDHPSRAGKI